eukprot:jgi/Tetstr1/438849/TSEL_027358.t1
MSRGAPRWDAPLQDLLRSGLLTGYALITSQGSLELATGVLEAEFGGASSALLNEKAQQFVGLFPPPSDQPPPPFELCGHKAVVLRQEERAIQALSRRREVGVCVNNLPVGVLVCTYGPPHWAQQVVPAVERCCDALRR